jgi:hypothetical protein
MKCDWTKENMVLYIYDELADDAKFEVENHIRSCIGCREELENLTALKHDMSAMPVTEVSPNLLAASRMQLQESLEQAEQNRSAFGMFIFDFAGWMNQIKLAPALTVALLMIGFAGGTITTWKIASNNHTIVDPGPAPTKDVDVASFESILTDPTSNNVTIKYDTLHPQTLVGSADDPRIQQLLLLATHSNRDSDVRLDSIDLLKDHAGDNDVRDALVSALRYDKNPGVRLKALDGLKGYVRNDVHVRDAVLEALLHDDNAGVRAEAIGLLDSVKADSSIREALEMLAKRDPNQFIRSQSQRYLASTPHLD